MPCSCFGKKDKKGGGVLGDEEKYRPRDSRERDPPAPAPVPVAAAPITKSQPQPQLQSQSQPLGAAPPQAPGTPPTPSSVTPTPGGDARLRPEDDPDKATRRRDVVASFYSDQCELIGFKATGSRPPSSHVGGQQDGPAATSSPATSSPSSTRSGGAFCRADLAEKRREFFRDLTIDDNTSPSGSRPTSRLTDPGSQQTPRHSHYQDQLHHTLPHLNKTSPRSNKFSTSTPLVLQHSLGRKSASSPTADFSSEETRPLLSNSSPQQTPKISPSQSNDQSVPKIPKIPSLEVSEASHFHDDDSEDTPLLLEEQHAPSDKEFIIDSSISTTVQKVSPEISIKPVDQSAPENKVVIGFTEVKTPELLIDVPPTGDAKFNVDLTSTDLPKSINDTVTVSNPESNVNLIDAFNLENPEFNVKASSEISNLMDPSIQQSPVVFEDVSSKVNSQLLVDDGSSPHSPQMKVDFSSPESDLFVNMSVPENSQTVDSIAIETQPMLFSTPVVSSTPKVEPSLQQDFQTVTFDSQFVESPPSFDKQFNVEFSSDPHPHQTTPVIINETLKDPFKEDTEHTVGDGNPFNTQLFTFDSSDTHTPQTIVETTRQFISGSPDEQKTSKTIVETTRQFITAPTDDQTTQGFVETTHQYITGSPDDQRSTKTIVETTRQFISGIPEDEETQNLMEKAQQFFSDSPGEQTSQTVVKTTKQVVSDSPDDQSTQTIVQTTQHFVSGSPDEQMTTTTIETTQQSLPPSVNPFFLTSAEEPDELPEKLLVQSTSTVTQSIEKPVAMPRVHFSEEETLEEYEKEEPKLPDMPCFGAPPPPSSPPPPLPEGQTVEDPFTSPVAVVIPPGEEEPLPPAPPTPPAEREVRQPEATAPLFEENQHQFESGPVPHTPHGDKEDLPPAPPTPPTPRLDDVLLPSTPPMENELLPPTPPTPHREDDLTSAPLTPPKEGELLTPSTPNPPISSSSHLPPVTCGVEIVSSTLEDDGLGSEIDDALESLEGISEEGNIERAAASS